jgi:malonyl CoA-acyl carrier protein transacylase
MTNKEKSSFSPIAVVGASGLFPGSINGQSFWRNILAGEDFMTEVPADHWLISDYYDAQPAKSGKIYGNRGAFLPKVDFDPMEFGMPPKQLSTTDTAQLLALIVASKVLEDAASVQFGKVDKADISVILGVASATEMVGQMVSRIQRPNWTKALRDAGIAESKVQEVCDGIEATYPEWDESTFPGLLGNVVAGRIANRLDLGGTNCVVDAACASSLGAVAMAISELQSGNSNLVITGGVDALNDIFMYMCFSQTPALSATGDCRPFSKDADGTMLGEGIGMVALRRLEDAQRDGDRIYSIIRGVGSSSDGRSGSIYAPESKGQALAIRRAYNMTDYDVDEVELIEAHGTATKAGDAAEFGGLRYAFEDAESADTKQWCALGSVKSQIGHTKSAAGAASLFKVVMALHHKVLPGTIKVSEPNPSLNIDDSPFYINTETRPWIHDPSSTRKGSVSSFGFGGSNFHVTLEEHVQTGEARGRYHISPVELLLFSGKSIDELVASAKSAVTALPNIALSMLAKQLQQDFDAGSDYRLSIVAKDADSAATQIGQAVDKIRAQPADTFSMPNKMHFGLKSGDKQKVGFIFPGQGSQYVNMGSELACEFDQARTAWDIASTVKLDGEQRLDQVVFPIPVFNDADRKEQNNLLTNTDWAQPAIGCVSSSMLNLLDTLELKPDAVAGHSYGEVTALYAAGALKTSEDLISVSRRRGELMKAAAALTPGSMTAVRANSKDVQAHLDQWDCEVVIANINSPSQVVIAGETSEIEKVEKMLEEAKLTFRRLPVATAFHTHIVSPSAEPFHEFLTDIDVGKPTIPVYSNTTAAVYSSKADEIRKNLAWQLANPVRFEELIQQMHDDGIRVFLEVGPGSVLAGMVKDCLKGRDFEVISLDNKKLDGRAAFWNAMGSLSAAGIVLNYGALWADFADVPPPEDSIKRSPITVKMGGANLGKPYPPENGSAGVPAPNPETIPQTAPAPIAAKVAAPVEVANTAPPAATVPVPVAPTAAFNQPLRDANWVAAFQSLQQQTLEAQKSFQSTLGEAHQAFLRASEVAFAQLGGNVPATIPVAAPVAAIQPATIAQAVPAAAPAAAPIAIATPVAMPDTPQPVPVAAAVVAEPVAIDFEGMLLDIVAEKTGYPKEMLTLDMELESGLGIDSIKRVEILSALQEQIPHLGELDTGELAELNTLGEIITFAGASAPSIRAATPAAPASTIDFEGLLLDVVAEKTGYPKEMLSLDMELESGLGIDSIKRVEILSSLQEQIPHLGEMDTAELAELNTLGEIISFASAGAPTATAPAAIDFEGMLLDVVAEKTGYPKDMLTLDMELESGLGIDSIKRVEILSALQEQIPHLGEMDTAELAELTTLGEIITFASGSAPESVAPTATSLDFESMLLDVVAEKTGYPKEMLSLDMELESGLGIDSIKRVEILSALQDQIPHLAEMDTAQLAELNTLGEIVAFASGSSAAGTTASSTSEVASSETIEMTRYEIVSEARAAAGIAIGKIQNAAPLYLVGDQSGIADPLATLLMGAGIAVKVVADAPENAQFVVLLTGLNTDKKSIGELAELNVEAFKQTRSCAAEMTANGKMFVTVQATGGDFGLSGSAGKLAWASGVAALAKTASREWLDVAVKAIDIATDGISRDEVAHRLFAELVSGGPELEVGLQADGQRITLVSNVIASGTDSLDAPLTEDSVIVVSGGARGVTAACLYELLQRTPAKLAILGRTALQDEAADLAAFTTDAELKKALLARYQGAGQQVTPMELNKEVSGILNMREVRNNLAKLESTGSKVLYIPTDISDENSVADSVEQAREAFGPITAIVHAAGVLADKEIQKKTDEQFQSVFSTKVAGLKNLLSATELDPLTHMICFSSVAARVGNNGQVDYAMANEVLNRVCQEEKFRRGAGFIAKSIGWGPWAGGMVDPSLAGHFRSQGVELIPMDDGARLFADEFEGRNGDCVEIVYGGGIGGQENEAQNKVMAIRVHPSTYPQIASHLIQGQPVVPMAMVNEWCLGIARALNPSARVVSVRDLSVLKGIQLPAFDTTGDWVNITCDINDAGDLLNMTVSNEEGNALYQLGIEIGNGSDQVTEPESPAEMNLGSWEWGPEKIYKDFLFHGEALQVVKKLLGVSNSGCSGMLQMPDGSDLERWRVALLDGGLQLALLWERHRSGLASLPTKFGQMKWHQSEKSEGPITCELMLQKATKLAATWSIVFTNVEKQIIATMEDVNIHVLGKSTA